MQLYLIAKNFGKYSSRHNIPTVELLQSCWVKLWRKIIIDYQTKQQKGGNWELELEWERKRQRKSRSPKRENTQHRDNWVKALFSFLIF